MEASSAEKKRNAQSPISPIQPGEHVWPAKDAMPSPVSEVMPRRPSYESDVTAASTLSGLTSHFPSGPLHANPPPAYVAHTGASQVVSEHQQQQQQQTPQKNGAASDSDHDDAAEHRPQDVQFSDAALALVNAFLDQLLYSFLSSARSTSLLALRPAVLDVLKHRLARAAIDSAEAELAELLGGADEEEELESKHKAQESKRKWDLELVWKRTRLRVMVYIRLGEMEDEDEQRYVEREDLLHTSERPFSSTSGLVSWSAAIFLTSVIEYVAEQTLQVAGLAACTRARRESRTRRSRDGDVIVEEHDVEKIALNPSLGRLWRTWRKALRNQESAARPQSSATRNTSRENMASAMSHYRSGSETNGSTAAYDSRPISRSQHDDIPDAIYSEHILAANIPLPMGNASRDVDEIVAVGLARDPDEVHHASNDELDSPYPEHVLAPLVPLPMHSEQKDLDELLIPGLSTDPDAQERDQHPLHVPYPSLMLALLVALPMLDAKRDVDEIEVPGLAKDPDAAPEVLQPTQERRRSFSGFLQDHQTPVVHRPRSTSLPRPTRTMVPVEEAPAPAAEEVAPHTPSVGEKEVQPAQNVEAVIPPTVIPVGVQGPSTKTALVTDNDARLQDTTATSDDAHEERKHAQNPEAKEVAAAGAAVGVAGLAGAATVAALNGDASSKPQDQNPDPASESKSLADMKSKSPSSASTEAISRPVPQHLAVQEAPLSRTSSEHSYTLDGKENVGTNSKEAGSNAVDATASAGRKASRGKKPQLTNLDTSPHPTSKGATTPRTPRTFLDLTNEDDDDNSGGNEDVEVFPLPPAAIHTARQPIQNGHSESTHAADDSTAHKKSFSRGSTPASHRKQDSNVQEHPVVQKMASLKSSEPSSASSETALPLTSAAIRGPEDFDMFIQGSETLKYTLTPEGVRDGPFRRSPSLAELDANPSPPRQSSASPARTGRSVTPRDIAVGTPEGRTSTGDKRRSVARPSPRNTSASRKGLLAREPRVLTESMRDFADFIRSTGPDKQAAPQPLVAQPSAASLRSVRSGNSLRGSTVSKIADRARSLKNGAEPVPPIPAMPGPTKVKTKMLARGAKAESDGSNDLIDFIRSGPTEEGRHRIARTVAPFRTTMDSDQFNDFSARPSADRQADASIASSSLRTSINSRSALLNGASTNGTSSNNPMHAAAVGASSNLMASEGEDPARKRYRNKDPYAIDFDFDDLDNEENDDLLSSTPPAASAAAVKPSGRNESFLDFLRTSEPPSAGPPKPLIDPNSPQARRLISEARARQQGSPSAPPTGLGLTTSADAKTRTTPANVTPRTQQQAQPASAFSGARPRQAQISSTAIGAVSTTNTPPRPKMEARSPGSKTRATGTSDALADFLRTSGPPPSDDGGYRASSAAPPPISRPVSSKSAAAKSTTSTSAQGKKKRGSIFGMGKKNTAYLDMP